MVKDWLGLILTDKQTTTIYHLQPLAMFFLEDVHPGGCACRMSRGQSEVVF